jgi:hypothetical protein
VAAVLPLVERAGQRNQVEVHLLLGVIRVESSFRPDARSSAGARGLMQLMPQTAASLARRLGRETYRIDDPEFNIEAGTHYLALLLRLFAGDTRLALAAYNTGPERVRRWQREGRPLPNGSERYVAAVLGARDAFATRGTSAATQSASGDIDQPQPDLDRDGLRMLLRQQQEIYGDRPDEPLPDDSVPPRPPDEGERQ